VDYAGGVKDLQAKVIRLIGNPVTRYREDPVRMLRAIRFAAKLDFTIHPNTAAPIANLGELLTAISPARLFDEVLKLLLSKHAVATFELLCQYNLLRYLVPATASCIDRDKAVKSFIHQACANTEARLATGKTVAPAFLYSVLLWYPLQQGYQQRLAKQGRPMTSLQQATSQVLNEQLKHTAIPKRFAWVIRDIWQLQWQLGRPGKRALSVLNHPRFRAGYDFLLTRQQAGEPLAELADWWTRLQQVDEEERQRMISQRTKPTKRSNYRRLSAKPTHST
jgi:poly(A) polymerase